MELIRICAADDRALKLAIVLHFLHVIDCQLAVCRRTKKWEAHLWDERHQVYLGDNHNNVSLVRTSHIMLTTCLFWQVYSSPAAYVQLQQQLLRCLLLQRAKLFCCRPAMLPTCLHLLPARLGMWLLKHIHQQVAMHTRLWATCSSAAGVCAAAVVTCTFASATMPASYACSCKDWCVVI